MVQHDAWFSMKAALIIALERLGWEVSEESYTDSGGEEGIMAGHGPYRLIVNFDSESGDPTGMVAEHVGDQALYARRWEGLESLPEPQIVVRRLSKRLGRS